MLGETQRRGDEGQPQEGVTIPLAAEAAPAADLKVEKPFDYVAEAAAVDDEFLGRTNKMIEWLKGFEATGALDVPEVTGRKDGLSRLVTEDKIRALAKSAAEKERTVEQYPEKAKEPMWQVTDLERKAAVIAAKIIEIRAHKDSAMAALKAKQIEIDKGSDKGRGADDFAELGRI